MDAGKLADVANGLLPGLKGAHLQLGIVVPEIESAAALWGALLGIGPWIAMDDYTGYRMHWNGEELDIGMTVAFSYFGDVQVELIQPTSGVRSPHAAWLAEGGSGFHHFGFMVDDYPAAMAAADAAGLKSAFEVSTPGAVNRTIYFEAPSAIGAYIEVINLPAARREGFRAIKETAAKWDGTRPFRKYRRIADFLADAQK
jgi:catechol 2,3-dioxygenase-like lactoylglutathione lyase family enzyme